MAERRVSLSALAHLYGTDKYPGYRLRGEQDYHCYTPFYEAIFRDFRPHRVLEIGIDTGASLRMWRDYWPGAFIFGVDNRPECIFQDDRIRCLQGDASDPNFLRSLLAFDLTIDDGSHKAADQILAAQILVSRIHVIEDINVADIPAIQAALPDIQIFEFETWHKDDDVLGVLWRG